MNSAGKQSVWFQVTILLAMTIIYLGIAWLVGVGLGAAFDSPLWLWLVTGFGSLLAAILARHKGPICLWFMLIGALSLGGARIALAEPRIDAGHIARNNGQGDVVITGSVVEEPELRDSMQRLLLEGETISGSEVEHQVVEGLILVETSRYPVIHYGAHLQIEGELKTPPQTPEFNQREYLARQGVFSVMSWPELILLGEGGGNPIKRVIYDIKSRARETIQQSLPDPQAALLKGILLGDESGLPSQLSDQFRTTGLTHIIAISGFNIAILTGILLAVSRPFLGQRWSAWFVLIGIALYTILVGADAAVVRAAIMGALFVIAARLLGRPTFAPAGLFTAAIVMTLINPFILWDIGFQLSFAATLGLMLYVGPWTQWSQTRLRRFTDPETAGKLSRMFSGVILATLAAMLLTLPIILYHFGHLSLISPVANLFVLPAQPGVMTWGGLATLTGMVFPAVGQVFAWVAWLFLTYTIGLVRLFASMPFATVPYSISLAGVVVFYALLFGATWTLFQKPEARSELFGHLRQNIGWAGALIGAGIVAGLAAAWVLSQPDGYLHVTFLDVGQGDATFIQTPSGRQILVDGGAYPSLLTDHLGRQIPFWDRDIDIVIATHPDADHVAALPGVFGRYRVGQLITNGQTTEELTYQNLLTKAAQNDTTGHSGLAGEVIAVGDGVQLEILNSTSRRLPAAGGQYDNDQSLALRLTYADFSLLLTGDTGQEAEQGILASGRPLSAVVYKAGHHGARTSSSQIFLEAVRPQYIVISAGEGNRFGHPHEEVLERAAQAGAAVLRTDELGTIELISDGQELWWEAKTDGR